MRLLRNVSPEVVTIRWITLGPGHESEVRNEEILEWPELQAELRSGRVVLEEGGDGGDGEPTAGP